VASWLSGIVEQSIRVRLRGYHDLGVRVLAEWDDLQVRAERVADEEWTRLMSEPGQDAADQTAIAARAAIAGQDFYDIMFPMGQTMVNLFTAGLYHLFEQQLVVFTRTMMQSVAVPGSMPGVFSLLNEQLGIDIGSLYPMASRLDQLRLIANVVKHAEGRSAETLRGIRPEIFEHPAVRTAWLAGGVKSRLVSEPLAGEGVYVTRADYEAYTADVDGFWLALKVDLDRVFA
jgi:hypothetical protein